MDFNVTKACHHPSKKEYDKLKFGKELRKAIKKIAKANKEHFMDLGESGGWSLDNGCFWSELAYEMFGSEDLFHLYCRELSLACGEDIMLSGRSHYTADKIPLFLDNKTGKIIEGDLSFQLRLERYKGGKRFFKFGVL